MYSKRLLKKYINERLKQKDWTDKRLAETIGMKHSNYYRAIESEDHNFTLPQLSGIVEALDFTPEQIFHILIGKKAKEATAQLVASSAKRIVDQILSE
jgi:DNA-binding Xre family transcriptional regulator